MLGIVKEKQQGILEAAQRMLQKGNACEADTLSIMPSKGRLWVRVRLK